MREIPEKLPKKIPEKPPVLKPVQWVLIKGRITNTKGRGISGLTIRILGLKGHALPNPVELKKIVTEKDGRFKIKISADSLNALIKSTRARSLHIYFEILDNRKRKLFDTKDCVEGIWDGDSFQIKRYPKSMACIKLAKLLEGLNIRLADFEAFVGSELEPEPAKPVLLLPMRLEIRKNDQSFKIRWYPDDIHVPIPIGKITEEEWTTFTEIYDESNFEGCAAQLEEVFGAIRTRQLVKYLQLNGELEPNGLWNFDVDRAENDPFTILLEDGVKIHTLPNMIHLYTLTDGAVQFVLSQAVENQRIEIKLDNLDRTSDDDDLDDSIVDDSKWMTVFEKALELGMGVVINAQSSPDQYAMLERADWLLVVGMNDEDAHQHLEELFQRRNASGQLGILPQDSPTNVTTAKTPYSDLETDILKYFEETSFSIPTGEIPNQAISRIETETLITDAKLLTDLFGFHPATFGEMPGANLTEQDEAASMSLLLVDICTSLSRIGWLQTVPDAGTLPSSVNWEEFMPFFVEHVRARGNFPIIRVDDIPYGILPVMAINQWEAGQIAGSGHETLNFVHKILLQVKDHFLELSKDITSLEPNKEANSFEKLLEVLQTNRVSNSVEVLGFKGYRWWNWIVNFNSSKQGDQSYVACPLVKSGNKPFQVSDLSFEIDDPLGYLQVLTDTSIPLIEMRGLLGSRLSKLSTSLLERIISDLLVRLEEERRRKKKKKKISFLQAVEDIPLISVSFEMIQKVAQVLAELHPDKVEILLMEIFDLLSHRIDAYITGFTHYQLTHEYIQRGKKPQIGVYGWLEKPSQFSNTETPVAEYIQTPSVAHANTVALLRNASLNNTEAETAFQLNLSSDQVKKGLWYLEALRQNRQPGEVIGALVERLIHEEQVNSEEISEVDIYVLRRKFPLPLQKAIDSSDSNYVPDERTFIETLINGEDFLTADLSEVFSGERLNIYRKIQQRVDQTKNAAADLVMAEISFQYVGKSNVDRAAACLDFLDGDVLHPELQFPRTPRTGDRHATQILLVIEPPSREDTDEILPDGEVILPGYTKVRKLFPRQMAAPLISHFCSTLMDGFATTAIQVNVSNRETPPSSFILDIIPRNDLHFESIDFLNGGETELLLRIKYFLLNKWKLNDDNIFSTFGGYPLDLPIEKQLNTLNVEYILDSSFSQKIKVIRYMLTASKRDQTILSTDPSTNLKLLKKNEIETVDLNQTIDILKYRATTLYTRVLDLELFFKSLDDLNMFLQPLRELHTSLELEGTSIDAEKQNWINLSIQLDNLKTLSSTFIDTFTLEFGATATFEAEIIALDLTDPVNLENVESKLDSLILSIDGLMSSSVFVNPLKKFLTTLSIDRGDLSREYDRLRWLSLAKILDMLKKVSVKYLTIYISEFGEETTFETQINNLFNLDQHSDGFETTRQNIRTQLYTFIQGLEELMLTLHDIDHTEIIDYLHEVSRYGYLKALMPLPPNLATSILFSRMLTNLLRFLEKKIAKVTTSLTDFISVPQGNFNSRLLGILTVLQEITDESRTLILTPFVRTLNSAKWQVDFTGFEIPQGVENELGEFAKVRPNLKHIQDFLTFNSQFKIYTDKYHRKPEQPNDPTDETINYGNVDYFYISTLSDVQNLQCWSCILIDDWWEFFPNKTETTAVAYRYAQAPQTESPNVLLYAVPPKINDPEGWGENLKILAYTLKDTIDLMQIRMVGPHHIAQSGFYSKFLPALAFHTRLGIPGAPLFPSVDKLYPKYEDLPFFNLKSSEFLPILQDAKGLAETGTVRYIYANKRDLEQMEYLQTSEYSGEKAQRTPDPKILGDEKNND